CSGNVPPMTFHQNMAASHEPRGLQRFLKKTLFQNVPVLPEHFGKAGGRVIRGFQIFTPTVFRMFRTKQG
uniref:hypothetical protein n=1 Tax=Pseudomonas putida TaxID=303 RepID=UPI0039069C92